MQDELTGRADRLFARRLKQAGIVQTKDLSSFAQAETTLMRAALRDLGFFRMTISTS